MLGDRTDAAEAACVLVRDEPIGARCAPLGQDALRSLNRRAMKSCTTPKPTPARTASSWVTAFALSKLVAAPP